MAAVTVDKIDLKGFKLFRRGKVRDVYDLDNKLLIISTDRISCFDVVLSDCVPCKGEILTQLSIFWFDLIKDLIPHHLLSTDYKDMPKELAPYRKLLEKRFMLVKKTRVIPFECVVRGYISGSGWKEYKKDKSVCGIELPAGLKESDKLPEPIFTPATKADVGHDMNVTQEYMEKEVGKDIFNKLKNASIAIYKKASQFAEKRGIIIADTKFEFGQLANGEIILIDEVLTPDSSRFWPKDEYKPGHGQPSFDKQFVRDYLESLDWNKTPPSPRLPKDIIAKTTEKYNQALKMITGRGLQD